MLSLFLKENSFKFNGKDYLQTHGTAIRTKMAVQQQQQEQQQQQQQALFA